MKQSEIDALEQDVKEYSDMISVCNAELEYYKAKKEWLEQHIDQNKEETDAS